MHKTNMMSQSNETINLILNLSMFALFLKRAHLHIAQTAHWYQTHRHMDWISMASLCVPINIFYTKGLRICSNINVSHKRVWAQDLLRPETWHPMQPPLSPTCSTSWCKKPPCFCCLPASLPPLLQLIVVLLFLCSPNLKRKQAGTPTSGWPKGDLPPQ